MRTVKAFEKGLICKGFRYEVGKEYTIPTEKIEMCMHGFHASANCDMSELVAYYNVSENVEYCLVDINVVSRMNDKVVGDKITILKKLSFDECIKYDRTGHWCYLYAKMIEGANIKKLQKAVIEKDETGHLCYYFARYIEGADIKKLQDAVVKKDKTGKWCYWFAEDIQEADIKRLQNAVIKKDKTGEYCYWFARYIEGADIKNVKGGIK